MSSRFWRPGGLLLAAVLCTSLVAAGPAVADPCDVDLVDSSEFRWDVEPSGGEVGDGFHMPTGRSDAYDTFGGLFVSTDDGASYSEYANPDELACTYEDDGREIAFPADTTKVAGLEIRRKVFVPATGLAFARWIDSFTNSGAAPIALRVRWGGNLGSDGGTIVTGSSSGDLAIDTADRWAGTSGGADPDLAHAWDTTFPGAADVADLVGEFNVAEPSASVDVGNVTAEYRDVVVQPGETVAYMHADAMRLTTTDAVASAERLGLEPDELDAGISAAEGAQIRNWNFGDRERDGLPNSVDNCPFAANSDQADLDGDGQGDPCDDDIDGDGRPNGLEGLFGTNPRSADSDGDGVRDVEDACPTVAGRGTDGCRRYDDLPGGTAVQTNTTPLRVKLAGVRRTVARQALLRRGLAFRARCNKPCSLRAELIGRVGAVRVAQAGDLLLGARRMGRKAGTHRVRVKVTRPRLRRVLARRARLKLRVTAIDAVGNRRVATRVIRIR
jgi:hypothetical protein